MDDEDSGGGPSRLRSSPSRLAGRAVVGDIIESLARGGADRGRLGPRDVPPQDPIIVVVIVG